MSISKSLSNFFPHQPNKQQTELFLSLDIFINNKDQDSCFILKGYAGTGKTTAVSALVNVLRNNKTNVVLLAPTGRAAKVLANYSGSLASTIHKKIYRKKSATNPELIFSLSPNIHKNTIFIVDEASM